MVISKEQIVDFFEKLKYNEDDFILKYDSSTFMQLLKDSLPKSKFTKIKVLFGQNIEDTKRHKKIIENLIPFIKNGKYKL
ncbi:MAG: hypothetical protein V1660_01400 [archaeon]